MSTPPFQPRPLDGIVARRIHTPRMILDDVLIEFKGTDIGLMGSFAEDCAAATPPSGSVAIAATPRIKRRESFQFSMWKINYGP